jgi:hypothetical protein
VHTTMPSFFPLREVFETLCCCCPWTVILPISAFQVAGITGTQHQWHPASTVVGWTWSKFITYMHMKTA